LLQQHSQSSSVEHVAGFGSLKATKEASNSSLHSALLDTKSRHHGKSGASSNPTDKVVHRGSKLAQSLLSDRRRTDSLGALELDGLFKMAAERPQSSTGHSEQKSLVDHGGSVRTDSGTDDYQLLLRVIIIFATNIYTIKKTLLILLKQSYSRSVDLSKKGMVKNHTGFSKLLNCHVPDH